ncbi:MAG: LEPR-XLL domain-containing protein, partial [Pirellulales bacterium]|nr:LEPR-XLL domain-containing protein [Pirellulales bacterium]
MAAPVSKKGALAAQPWFTAGRHGRFLRPFHKSSLEALEPRWMLSAAPTLAAIGDVALASGTPLYIALDGYDADGDTLTFSF